MRPALVHTPWEGTEVPLPMDTLVLPSHSGRGGAAEAERQATPLPLNPVEVARRRDVQTLVALPESPEGESFRLPAPV